MYVYICNMIYSKYILIDIFKYTPGKPNFFLLSCAHLVFERKKKLQKNVAKIKNRIIVKTIDA